MQNLQPLKALIVDDMESNIEEIEAKLAENCPHVTVIGKARNGKQAVQGIHQLSPDVVFLDVQMPDMTGFEVLEMLGLPPKAAIIFCTVYDHFACQAFRYSAVDFLTKPIDIKNLVEAVERAEREVKIKNDEAKAEQYKLMFSYLKSDMPVHKKLSVTTQTEILLIELDHIIYIKAVGSYAEIHTTSSPKPIISSRPLKYYRDLLTYSPFFDAQRSFLINVNYITSIVTNELYVIMSNKHQASISALKINSLKAMISI